MAHSAFRRFGSIVVVLSLAAGAWAAPTSESLLPATTKGYIATSDVDEVRAKFRETQLGELVNDPVMKPFIDDLKDQIGAKLEKAGKRMGLKWADMEGVYGGEVALALVQPEVKGKEAMDAKAKTEADETLGRSKAEAETTAAQSRKEAAERLQRSQEEVAALREEAEARRRELHADTEAIRQERRVLLDDIRGIAARVQETASGADARFPPPEPDESPEEEMLEPEPEAETERSGVAAADEPHDGNVGRQVRPGR